MPWRKHGFGAITPSTLEGLIPHDTTRRELHHRMRSQSLQRLLMSSRGLWSWLFVVVNAIILALASPLILLYLLGWLVRTAQLTCLPSGCLLSGCLAVLPHCSLPSVI